MAEAGESVLDCLSAQFPWRDGLHQTESAISLGGSSSLECFFQYCEGVDSQLGLLLKSCEHPRVLRPRFLPGTEWCHNQGYAVFVIYTEKDCISGLCTSSAPNLFLCAFKCLHAKHAITWFHLSTLPTSTATRERFLHTQPRDYACEHGLWPQLKLGAVCSGVHLAVPTIPQYLES